MKLLRLELQAFGPFLTKQVISFEELSQKGMYLIDGPTGSGKTTIFDAISYALFNAPSGDERRVDMLRSGFADSDIETYVLLDFEANGEKYSIRRSPRYLRKSKKDKEGLTEVSAKHELRLPNGVVLNKTNEIKDKLENEILFITREQFKHIALLAQGEFTDLVVASSDDRAKILEHIFGQEIYAKVQYKISDLWREAQIEKNKVESGLKELILQVDEKESIIGYQEAMDDVSNVETFIDNLKLKEKGLEEELKEKEEQNKIFEKEYLSSNEKYTLASKENDTIRKYKAAVASLEELSKRKNQIEEYKITLIKSGEFDSVKHLVNNYNSVKKNIDTNKDSLKKKNEEKIKVEEENKALPKLIEENDLRIKEKENISNLLTRFNDILKRRPSLFALKKEVASKTEELKKSMMELNKLDSEFSDTSNRFFLSSAFNLSQKLEDNNPCPVCGSTSHPHPAEASNPVSEEEYKKADKLAREKRTATEKLRSEKIASESRLKEQEEIVEKLLKEVGFDGEIDVFYGDSFIKLVSDKERKRDLLVGEIKEFDDYKIKLEKKVLLINQEITSLEKNINQNEEQLKLLSDKINVSLTNNKHIKTREDYIEYQNNPLLSPSLIKNEVEEYGRSVLVNETTINNTPEELRNKNESSVEELKAAMEDKERAFKEQQAYVNSVKMTSNSYKKSLDAISKKYEECKNVLYKYKEIHKLYDAATGKNERKLDFRMYVLADYFDKIVSQANKRLNVISNGRYSLIRREETKGNGTQGLNLDVYDYEIAGNRDAGSLSGGEKFVTALSLALGLSDIIESSHGLVRVESIFIDEGFGTLDDEYLDMAMKALEKLQSSSKSVAIISHVEKLRSYIQNGIEVIKTNTGSTIKLKENI